MCLHDDSILFLQLNESGFGINCSDRTEVTLTAIAASLLPSVNQAWDSTMGVDNIDDCLWIERVIKGQQSLRKQAQRELNCPNGD